LFIDGSIGVQNGLGSSFNGLSGDHFSGEFDNRVFSFGDLQFSFSDLGVDQFGSFRSNVGEASGVDFSGTFGDIVEEPVIEAITRTMSSFKVTGKTSSVSTESAIDSVETFITFKIFTELVDGII